MRGFKPTTGLETPFQSAVLDIEDVTFRDVRTSISSRHRATGFILGAEGYKMLRVKYNDSKDFKAVGCSNSAEHGARPEH